MDYISLITAPRDWICIGDIWEIRYDDHLCVIGFDLGQLSEGHLTKMDYISLIIAPRAWICIGDIW